MAIEEELDEIVKTKCMGCGSMSDEEHFLLCDNEKIKDKHGAHLHCLDPALKSIPKTDWFCPKCDKTKHISKLCIYCSSIMYQCNKKNLIKCSSKSQCRNIAHSQCIKKANQSIYNNNNNNVLSKWKCPKCLNLKKWTKLMKKNNKLMIIEQHPNIYNEINWNLFEIVEINEMCSVGQSCKKLKENKKKHYHCKDIKCYINRSGIRWFTDNINEVKKHQLSKHNYIKNKSLNNKRIKPKRSQFEDSDSDNDNDNDKKSKIKIKTPVKIEKIKIEKKKLIKFEKKIPKLGVTVITNKLNDKQKMINSYIDMFLSVANLKDISMKKRSNSICKCLLQRTNDLSKSIITIWLKKHNGNQKIIEWLEKAIIKLTNPKINIDGKIKKDAEKLIIDLFSVIKKIKFLRIEWNLSSTKLNQLFNTIINNSRIDNINVNKQAKQCRIC